MARQVHAVTLEPAHQDDQRRWFSSKIGVFLKMCDFSPFPFLDEKPWDFGGTRLSGKAKKNGNHDPVQQKTVRTGISNLAFHGH
jgi:hypothetical protein